MNSFEVIIPDYYKQKRSIPRFPPDLDIDDKNQILQYFRNHSIKALSSGISWSGIIEDLGWGAKTRFFDKEDFSYTSIYVYKSHRGAKKMSEYISTHTTERFCTTPSCEIENYLKSKNAQYVVLQDCSYPEYKYVQQYYGDTVTDRTGIHMMNHIDEGLFILEKINASENAKMAYIAHPLMQSDADLTTFWKSNGPDIMSRRILLLALEYRNIANAHLSYHPSGLDNFMLSPLKEVNDMLIADKIQNRKDFELYHMDSHPRSDKLKQYFIEWLQKLGITEEIYAEMKNDLINRTGGLELALKSQSTDSSVSVSAVSASTCTSGPNTGFNQVPDAIKKTKYDHII